MVARNAAAYNVTTSDHSARINGREIPYQAQVTELPLPNQDGDIAVVGVSYAYVASDVADRASRPVLFIFNGGPGASSSPLHLQAFGPRRKVGEGADLHLEDNAYSLLDVADLVFIDPPGTGASMPVEGADPSGLFGVTGDADAVTSMIYSWLDSNDRMDSPIAIMGESYGTARTLAILDRIQKRELKMPAGIALLSLAIGDDKGPLASNVTVLPTLAATAWYHQAIDRGGKSVQQHFDEALHFAQTEYLQALVRGVDLPASEKRAVAEKMSALIGLPPEDLMASNLHLSKHDFMLSLLSEEGLRIGQLDGRAKRAIADSNLQPPFDDPSMTLGTGTGDLIARYFKDELGYSLPSEYRSLNLGINFKWDWGGSYETARFTPYLMAAYHQDPDLKLFTSGGYYDITTPAYAGVFALDQAGVPRAKRATHFYASGHSVFEDEGELKKLSADLRGFLHGLSGE
ncbi:peptidase S10 [Altererythrobacter endophyticus]|uniref:Peptidase S10 n=2 Tax=Altericroceibacterium endophyticum TaxID=1808508 RepID=A0A6I4T5N8_9SPHN|nr:peptidase S10 [Altericroceibacterium endophyticum]